MYLFFDTETTGLPKNYKAPVTDTDNWPRLVQLAFLLHDEAGNKITRGDFIVQPTDFVIPKEASDVHGITTERAAREGVPLLFVLQEFDALLQQAGCLVAHNIAFDEKIIGAEFVRNGMLDALPGKKKICTMESAKNFCAINGKYGYKWPKLSELHNKLFLADFEEAHNAAADIQATARCFWELKKRGII